ncbi:MAG: hypothetical protein GY861_06690 [bacterium]|nr:hypothetical protein [bacterium]
MKDCNFKEKVPEHEIISIKLIKSFFGEEEIKEFDTLEELNSYIASPAMFGVSYKTEIIENDEL